MCAAYTTLTALGEEPATFDGGIPFSGFLLAYRNWSGLVVILRLFSPSCSYSISHRIHNTLILLKFTFFLPAFLHSVIAWLADILWSVVYIVIFAISLFFSGGIDKFHQDPVLLFSSIRLVSRFV